MIIRKAKASDKSKVLDFCKNTFSWGDYIVDVWDYWIVEGNLLVLTENKTPAAICHSSFFDKQVWIEGIRVNEKFRKKGFAKKIKTKVYNYSKQKFYSYELISFYSAQIFIAEESSRFAEDKTFCSVDRIF